MRINGSRLVVAVLLVALIAGCATEPTDYRAVWSSSPATPTDAAPPVSFFDYLKAKGVDGTPMTPQNLTEITVSMPRPPGWAVVTDENLASAYEVLRKTAVAAYQPTAALYVFKLIGGEFDVNEALTHAPVAASGAQMDPLNGLPSSWIEVTYADANGQKVHRYNRFVVATAKSSQRYLVQFSVTTSAEQAQEADPDVLTIIKGFTVAVR